jgi:predicted enzyme related to lactoylglutathione lyase
MGNPIGWFEVVGKDLDGLKGFYSGMFDWKLTDMEEMPYTTVETDQGAIGGGLGTDPTGGNGHVTFYVQVDNVEDASAKADSLGGSKLTDPIDIPGGGRIAHVTDPEGHMVGLLEGMEG